MKSQRHVNTPSDTSIKAPVSKGRKKKEDRSFDLLRKTTNDIVRVGHTVNVLPRRKVSLVFVHFGPLPY